MNPTYIYNGERLELKPILEEPNGFDPSFFTFKPLFDEREAHYAAHRAACKADTIAVSDELKAVLKEGQEVTENVDFRVQKQVRDAIDFKKWISVTNNALIGASYMKRTIAVPIQQPPPTDSRTWEDELKGWLHSKINRLAEVEGDVIAFNTIAGSAAIRFANGNGYWIRIDKQAEVSLD